MRQVIVLLLSLALTVISPALLADPSDPQAEARILVAMARIVDDRVWLDATVSLTLNKSARRALERGLPLTFTAHTQIYRARQFWWDESVLNREHSFRLEYHELSQQYVIENLSSGAQRVISSQEAALQELGLLRGLRLFHVRHLKSGETYYGELRTELAVEDIPLTLKASAYMSDDWIIRSNTFTWPLQ